MRISAKYKWKGIGRKVVLAFLVSTLAWIFLFGNRGLYDLSQKKQLCQIMTLENDSLKTDIQEIGRHSKAIIDEDSLEIERWARFLGMVRPGEEIYIFRNKDDTTRTLP